MGSDLVRQYDASPTAKETEPKGLIPVEMGPIPNVSTSSRWDMVGRAGQTALAVLVLTTLLGGVGLVLQHSLAINAVLVLFGGLTLLAAAVAVRSPSLGLTLFLVGVVVGDLAKRLLFLTSDVVTQLEYQAVLALPDMILLALIASLLLRVDGRSLSGRLRLTDFAVLVYVGWVLLGLWRPGGSLYVGLVGAKLSGVYIALYFVGARLVDTPERFRHLARVTILLAVPTALYGLGQAVFGYSWFEWQWLESGLTALADPGSLDLYGIHRIFSTFASHEQFGFYLAAALLLLPTPGLFRSRRVIGVPLSLVLIRTISRSSWMAFVVAVVFPRLLGKPRGRWLRIAGGLILGVLALGVLPTVAAGIDAIVSNPLTRRAAEFGTYEARTRTFQLLVEDPTYRSPLGNGLGMMWGAWRLGENSSIPIVSHSGTVDILYELGWIGLVIFCLACLTVLSKAVRTRDRSSVGGIRHFAATVCIGYVAAVLVVNTFVATLLILRPIAVFFWLFLGIASRLSGWPDDEAAPADGDTNGARA